MKKSLAIDRACVVANYNLGIIELVHKQKKKEAKKLFSQAIKVESGHVESLRYMSRISISEGNSKEAEQFLIRAIENTKDTESKEELTKELLETRKGNSNNKLRS